MTHMFFKHVGGMFFFPAAQLYGRDYVGAAGDPGLPQKSKAQMETENTNIQSCKKINKS